MDREDVTVKSPPRHQTLVRDAIWLGRRNRMGHGLLELDVTEPRRHIDAIATRTTESLSFTAFLTACLAEAIDRHKEMQTYRNWRNHHVIFDDVDVLVMIETGDQDSRVPTPHVIRAANERSIDDIHEEIRGVQHGTRSATQNRFLSSFVELPTPVRRLSYRFVKAVPRYWKRFGGTVAVTSVGMFGNGGGWAIPIANHTLELTVGGIDEKPRVVEDEIQTREVLNVTLSVNHEVIDGAPAARFADEFRDLVEDGYGLE